MTAAKTCSIWAVRILLHGNVQADPNKVDKQNFTALDYALKANNSRIINILAEVTTVFSERSIETLAQSKVRIGDGGHIEKYIQKIINYSDTPEHRTVNYYDAEGAKYYYDARETSAQVQSNSSSKNLDILFSRATFYGNLEIITYLLKNTKVVLTDGCIENVIKSDDVKSCQVVTEYCKMRDVNIKTKYQHLAESRGNIEIMKLFDSSQEMPRHLAEEKIIPILKHIPRHEEYLYGDVMDNIICLVHNAKKELISSKRLINYETLLENLHVPPVHYNREDIESCDEKCSQKSICRRVRDVTGLLEQILTKMSEVFPIFKDVATIVVGSLKEGTKLGGVDEADVTLALCEKYQKHLNFDKKLQKIMVRKYIYENISEGGQKIKLDIPEELRTFILKLKDSDQEHIFVGEYYGFIDTNKYFLTFMETFYKTVASGNITLPTGLTLSTQFIPCRICMNHDNVVPQYIRCKHNPHCEEHLKRNYNPNYEENCDCRVYTSPCMSYSKIGLVLHLKFVNQDGSSLYLDVDVNPPSFPVSKRRYKSYSYKNQSGYPSADLVDEPDFDGSNTDKRAWLEKYRPVGWKVEWDKTEDMSDAVKEGDDLRRAVRLRFHNHRDVLAEQVGLSLMS